MAAKVTITPIEGNVNKGGAFTKVPDDTSPDKMVTGAYQYYNWNTTPGTAKTGGDPMWPALQQDVKSPLEKQKTLRYTKVLLETDAPVSTCNWELYALKEEGDAGIDPAKDPLIMTKFLKRETTVAPGQAPGQATLGFRAGRKFKVSDGAKYDWLPLYQDYPVPVFKRVNGPRVVVDLPVPEVDGAYNYVVDLILPGKHEPEAGVPHITVTVASGVVSVSTPSGSGGTKTGTGGTGTSTGGTGTGTGTKPGGTRTTRRR